MTPPKEMGNNTLDRALGYGKPLRSALTDRDREILRTNTKALNESLIDRYYAGVVATALGIPIRTALRDLKAAKYPHESSGEPIIGR